MSDQTDHAMEHELVAAVDHIAEMKTENERLETWIDDLQAGGWVNCVYCGKRYGARDEQLKVHETMREALAEHVESCPKHPLAKCRADLAERDRMLLRAESLFLHIEAQVKEQATEIFDLRTRAEKGSET